MPDHPTDHDHGGITIHYDINFAADINAPHVNIDVYDDGRLLHNKARTAALVNLRAAIDHELDDDYTPPSHDDIDRALHLNDLRANFVDVLANLYDGISSPPDDPVHATVDAAQRLVAALAARNRKRK